MESLPNMQVSCRLGIKPIQSQYEGLNGGNPTGTNKQDQPHFLLMLKASLIPLPPLERPTQPAVGPNVGVSLKNVSNIPCVTVSCSEASSLPLPPLKLEIQIPLVLTLPLMGQPCDLVLAIET